MTGHPARTLAPAHEGNERRDTAGAGSALFSPFPLGDVVFRNRCVVAPMQVYAAAPDGLANDWHFQHLAKFAVGGAAAVITEGLAVDPAGRNTYGDLGIWSEAQAPALGRIASFLKSNGAVAGAQLHHAGPRASRQRPWDGLRPLGHADALRGEPPWQAVGPSAVSFAPGWPAPHELSLTEIATRVEQFGAAARRCHEAGFDLVEVHAGHDYLIHAFLSPHFNRRNDAYGGERAARMRLALEVAEAVRANWPAGKPLFFRISCVDRDPGGWSLDDAVALSCELARRGVDLVDCSSSGTNDPFRGGSGRVGPRLGFQVPYARHLRREAAVPTMAVGLIVDARQAERIIAEGSADLVAIGREALFNPHWVLHAAHDLGVDPDWDAWPPAYGWWLNARQRAGFGGEWERSAGETDC